MPLSMYSWPSSRISFSFWLYLSAIQVLKIGFSKNSSRQCPLGGKYFPETSRNAPRSVPSFAVPVAMGAAFSVSITSVPSTTANLNACSHQIQRPFELISTGPAWFPPATPCRRRMSTAYFSLFAWNGCFRPSSTSPPHQYSSGRIGISNFADSVRISPSFAATTAAGEPITTEDSSGVCAQQMAAKPAQQHPINFRIRSISLLFSNQCHS